MMIQDVQQLAREMREYIETHGWVQGTSEDRTGAVCLAGAMGHVVDGSRFGKGDMILFFGAFERVTGREFMDSWNDAPERTYEDVILLLKRIEDGDY